MTDQNLVQQLGGGYVLDMFAGALFIHDNSICVLRELDGDKLVVHSLPMDSGDWKAKHIPADALRSFNDFKYPELGYRQMKIRGVGEVITYMSLRRSAHRGLRVEMLMYESPFVFDVLSAEGATSHASDKERLRAIYNPQYTDLSTGVKQLLAGERVGFAVDNSIAVVMNCSTNDEHLAEVLFKTKRVGHVDMNGEVTMFNKVMQRSSNRRLYVSKE